MSAEAIGSQREPSLWEDGRPTPAELEVVDWLLTTTRANRKTLDLTRPVEPEVIEECLQIALQAPVAHNDQRWHWVVVSDPEKRKLVAEVYADVWESVTRSDRRKVRRFKSADQVANRTQDSANWLCQHLHEVPILVIPCMVGPGPNDARVMREYERLTAAKGTTDDISAVPVEAAWWGSIFPAMWSFHLALRSRGLGTVMTVAHLAYERRVADILGIPSHAQQMGLMPVAYLTKTVFKPAPRAALETRLSWNVWSGTREQQ